MIEISKEDKYFLSSIKNMISSCDKNNCPSFSLFLDEKQQVLSQSILSKNSCKNYVFCGGYENAHRKILCIYPDYLLYDVDYSSKEDLENQICRSTDEGDNSLFFNMGFPMDFLKITWNGKDELNHRDFLGSLMALNIKREMIGDILIFNDYAVVMLQDRITEYVINNLIKVSNTGVFCKKIAYIEEIPEIKFETIQGTVSSFRSDCIVALITKLSRSNAANLIEEGRLSINHTQTKSVNTSLNSGDVISIRGYGRFVLLDDVGQTKKGRYHVKINKFI